MKNLTMKDLKGLIETEGDLCISIYMPTDPSAVTTDKQRIRFKNLLRQAERSIQNLAPPDKRLLAQIEEGRRLLENEHFWRNQSNGLAVFITAGALRFHRLPLRFEETVTTGHRFHIKPLLPFLMADERFFILALSLAEIRLFNCTRHHVVEIEVPDMPEGIADSLRYDDKEYQLQYHTGTSGEGGERAAMYHGQGVGVDDRKNDILRYFQDVNRALAPVLTDPNVPLVLAGVDYLLPLFREATSHRRVIEEGVLGNPDALRGEDLHGKVLEIIRPELEASQREAEERYRELAGKGFTAAGVRAVVPAAVFGRVDTLFIVRNEKRPGTFDRTKSQVRITGDSDASHTDLLDLAAVETLRNGGSVYAVDRDRMPDEHTVAAAILRF
jgi:hypothetical protein